MFNALTGLKQKVGNFPGITVDKKTGECSISETLQANIIDLPGTYSLYPRRSDEWVAYNVMMNPGSKEKPDAYILVADASNLKRNLLFAGQVIDLKRPVVIALTMMDIASKKGITIDISGLERELGASLPGPERLELAAEIGSDVPLFLLGGSVLGLGRGEQVFPFPDLPGFPAVVAIPGVGVSTPQAFRDWDALTQVGKPDKLNQLSLAYASLYAQPGTSGIVRSSPPAEGQGGYLDDLAENTLLSLVRAGIENDFERVVFPVHPSLREIKHQLMGHGSGRALYAALSGSGSALFGLYRSEADALEAQQRVQNAGTKAIVTRTLPRAQYWTRMFAE